MEHRKHPCHSLKMCLGGISLENFPIKFLEKLEYSKANRKQSSVRGRCRGENPVFENVAASEGHHSADGGKAGTIQSWHRGWLRGRRCASDQQAAFESLKLYSTFSHKFSLCKKCPSFPYYLRQVQNEVCRNPPEVSLA